MAFPQKVSATPTETTFTSAVTAHAANMPVSVDAGDLLLAMCVFEGSSAMAVTTPSGWTQVAHENSTRSTQHGTGAIYAKTAAGTEGGTTVDFATDNAGIAIIKIFQVTGWDGTVATGIDVSTALIGGGTGGVHTFNAPTAGWGSADNLFGSFDAMIDDGLTGSFTVGDFTDEHQTAIGSTNAGCSLAGQWAETAAATDTPDDFTPSAAQTGIRIGFVIQPGTSGGGLADLVAAAGSYTQTGVAAGLVQGWVIVAAAGSYAKTGVAAALTYSSSHPITDAPTVFSNGTPGTTHNVTMPASTASGGLLITGINVLAIAIDSSAPEITTPSGWERPVGVYGNRTIGANRARCAIYKRLCDGTEGGTTVNFATDDACISAAHTYYIAPDEWSGTLAEILGQATIDPGASVSPDAANFAPGLGTRAFLVLNFAFSFDDAAEATTAPTNYIGLVSTEVGGADTGLGVGSAKRTITSDQENAGAWTLSASQNWYSTITFVPPVSAGGGAIPHGPLGHPLHGPFGGPI